jgi:hypothetical protein
MRATALRGHRRIEQEAESPFEFQTVIDILNEFGFSVFDPGPLSEPIVAFKIRRDHRFALLIDTEAVKGAKSRAEKIAPGTVCINLDKIELRQTLGATARTIASAAFATGAARSTPALTKCTQGTAVCRRASILLEGGCLIRDPCFV